MVRHWALLPAVAAALVAALATADVAAVAPPGSVSRACQGLRIGLLAPLSGPASSFGQEQLSWARFANRRHNREYPRLTFRLVERDTALDAAQAQARASELAADSRVMVVVGPAGSQEVAVVAPTFRSKGIAYISGSARAAELTRGPKRIPNFFRVVAPDPAQTTLVVGFIRRDLDAKRVWVIDDRSDYSLPLADAAVRQLRAAGATVTRSSVGPEQADFARLLARMPVHVDVVYLPWDLASRARSFYQQLRMRAKSPLVVGSDRLDAAEWLGAADGQFYASFAPDVRAFTDRRTRAVVAAYVSEFGDFEKNSGPPVFAAVQVAQAALRKACRDGAASRLEVQQQLRLVRMPSILGYSIRFRGGDTVGARFWLYRVEAGRGVFVR